MAAEVDPHSCTVTPLQCEPLAVSLTGCEPKALGTDTALIRFHGNSS